MIVIEVRLPLLRPCLKNTSWGFPNPLIWQYSFGWRSNRYQSSYGWRSNCSQSFYGWRSNCLQIFLLVKLKPLQIFLLVKSNHTQSSFGWRLNLFNKWFVVYNNGSLKSSNIQYAHINSVSKIWLLGIYHVIL